MTKRPWIDDSQNADKEDAVNRVFFEGLKNVLQHVATSIRKKLDFGDRVDRGLMIFGCSKS